MNYKVLFMRIFVCLSAFFFLFSCGKKDSEGIRYSKEEVQTPQLFAPGVISTEEANEFDLCFNPDGKTVYFTRRIPGTKQQIYRTDYNNETWTKPVVAPFSTDRDETPFITPDGEVFYFGSERPIPGKPNLGGFDMNVWKMVKEGDSWSEPEPLSSPINEVQVEGENWPSSNNNFLFSLDGKQHYYTTMVRGSKTIDVYTVDLKNGQFGEPKRIEGLFENDSLWKYSASVSPNGKYLVFNSYAAPGGKGGEDLYVSQRTEAGWSKAKGIDLINSEGEESSGRFSPDGRYFFFTHADNLGNDEYGPWSIYYIETSYLKLETLFD